MKKYLKIIIPVAVVAVIAAAGLIFMNGKTFSKGLYLSTDSGRCFWINGSTPVVLGEKNDNKFKNLSDGDEILVFHENYFLEIFPEQTKIYFCIKLKDGDIKDVPQSAVDSLTDLNYFEADSQKSKKDGVQSDENGIAYAENHSYAGTAKIIDNPISGYCGNIQTVIKTDGEEFGFCFDDSVKLTDILINAEYDPDELCKCISEFKVVTEASGEYEVNLTQKFIRCERGQIALTKEQAEIIKEIFDRQTGKSEISSIK